MTEPIARREATLKSVAEALRIALADSRGYLASHELMRDVARAVQELLPDVRADEILDAIQTITKELRRQVGNTDRQPFH